MILRKILVPLSGQYGPDDPDGLDAPALEYALRAAHGNAAHVQALCITRVKAEPDSRWLSLLPDYGVRELTEMMDRQSEDRRQRAEAAFQRVVSTFEPPPLERASPGEGFSVSYREHDGDIATTIGEFGALSDALFVASSKARWEMPFRPILEASLRRSGRPVFVSPPIAAQTFATRVAVAWNGSVEAARAVAASIELIRAAERVLVISCAEKDADAADPDGVVEYLAWHGVGAKAVRLTRPRREAAAAIIERARSAKCDLIVLGSYVHSRAHRLLFGSMTQYVLGQPALPALLVP